MVEVDEDGGSGGGKGEQECIVVVWCVVSLWYGVLYYCGVVYCIIVVWRIVLLWYGVLYYCGVVYCIIVVWCIVSLWYGVLYYCYLFCILLNIVVLLMLLETQTPTGTNFAFDLIDPVHISSAQLFTARHCKEFINS